MKKNAQGKCYVVWTGKQPGIYTSWTECEKQIKGFEKAQFKSYSTRSEAEQAFEKGLPVDYYKPRNQKKKIDSQNPATNRSDTVLPLPKDVVANAIAVDAACSKNPGPMEYRGINLRTGQELFHFGPIQGTNNIGEFLAIVHALAFLQQQKLDSTTVYSDSHNALLWISKKQCRTKLKDNPNTHEVLRLIERAVAWLNTHNYKNPVLKWQTKKWGETPADFGRK